MSCLFHTGRARQHPALVIYGSAKHAGMKKAASIFLKSRKFITAWFDNECVATPVVLPKNILQCTRSRLTVQCWWKTKKININILIAKGGLKPLQPPPWLRLWNGTFLYAPCFPVRWVQMLVWDVVYHKKHWFHANTVMVFRFAGVCFHFCLASWLFQQWNMGEAENVFLFCVLSICVNFC